MYRSSPFIQHSQNNKIIEIENKVVATSDWGVEGRDECDYNGGGVMGISAVTEQFYIMIVVVVTQIHTYDKITQN